MTVILRKDRKVKTIELEDDVCIHDAACNELSSITDALLSENDFFETGILSAFVREGESDNFDNAEEVLNSDSDALFYKVSKINGIYSSLGFGKDELKIVYNNL